MKWDGIDDDCARRPGTRWFVNPHELEGGRGSSLERGSLNPRMAARDGGGMG